MLIPRTLTGLFLSALFLSGAVHAQDDQNCDMVIPIYTAEIDDLIARSSRIVVAEDARWSAKMPDRDALNQPAREDQLSQDRATAQLPAYRLKVIETLKGDASPSITVVGAAPFSAAQAEKVKRGEARLPTDAELYAAVNIDFDTHRAGAFWRDRSAGRVTIGSDCEIRPQFTAGARYLIFVGAPHVKGFEVINAADDQWLRHVRTALAGTHADG